MLGRFYAICNCCSCCCGAMNAQRNGTPMIASSGYVAVVDEDMCAACGTCADYCQFEAITVDNGYAVVDYEACMGCGVCVAHCPQEAISLLRDPARGEPLEIQKLIAYAAQATQETVDR
jgi:MinD superfamily P-loop ATPase